MEMKSSADTSAGMREVLSKFHGYASVRFNRLYGIKENKDIRGYVGYSEFATGYETSWHGVWQCEGWFAPGDLFYSDYKGISYSLGANYTFPWDRQENRPMVRVPLTLYIRYFNGFNEFLETYNAKTEFVGFGFKLRG
jgi:outer membrane phospholipase A